MDGATAEPVGPDIDARLSSPADEAKSMADERQAIRPMSGDDFAWAAALMAQRRQRYEAYSPVFWRPAVGVETAHAAFLRAVASSDGAQALRSDRGFVVATAAGDRCVVDDFAVMADADWAATGRGLLLATWAGRPPGCGALRVVTAREDGPKREMLRSLGLEVAERWWVKELTPSATAAAWGPVVVAGLDALLVPAPPVYDPGGPVCLLGDAASTTADRAADAAAALGAVLAVVARASIPTEAEPELEAAGFHNPSEFYEGVPRVD